MRRATSGQAAATHATAVAAAAAAASAAAAPGLSFSLQAKHRLIYHSNERGSNGLGDPLAELLDALGLPLLLILCVFPPLLWGGKGETRSGQVTVWLVSTVFAHVMESKLLSYWNEETDHKRKSCY